VAPKPRRGCLFIATVPIPTIFFLFFLFFGGAETGGWCGSSKGYDDRQLVNPYTAPPKNKKKEVRTPVRAMNRQPLRGLGPAALTGLIAARGRWNSQAGRLRYGDRLEAGPTRQGLPAR